MSTRRRVLALAVLCAVLVLPWHSFLGSVEAQSGTAIQVDVAANRRPIDPRVYGVNWADAAQLAALNVPVHRWGGNSTTRHNWKTNGDNRGSDWYFESIPGSGAQGAAFDDFVQQSKQNGSEPMVTIPLIGWVGKNGPGGTKLASFSAAKYGAQQDCDWSWFPDACNGVRHERQQRHRQRPQRRQRARRTPSTRRSGPSTSSPAGAPRPTAACATTSTTTSPASGTRTHRDVHPAGQTMTELRDLMIAYGTAIRQADPGAVFVGPEEWGWIGLLPTPATTRSTATTPGAGPAPPTRPPTGAWTSCPGCSPRCASTSRAPATACSTSSPCTTTRRAASSATTPRAAMQARRNRSTRSLWDPSYTDETWIGDEVRLIPRMKEWVNANYPGLETGITEYSWGADGPHQRRHRPGRRPRHLRTRGAQRRHPLGGPGHRNAHVQGHPDVPQLRRQQVRLRRHQRQGHGPQPGHPLRVRGGADERRRRSPSW